MLWGGPAAVTDVLPTPAASAGTFTWTCAVCRWRCSRGREAASADAHDDARSDETVDGWDAPSTAPSSGTHGTGSHDVASVQGHDAAVCKIYFILIFLCCFAKFLLSG